MYPFSMPVPLGNKFDTPPSIIVPSNYPEAKETNNEQTSERLSEAQIQKLKLIKTNDFVTKVCLQKNKKQSFLTYPFTMPDPLNNTIDNPPSIIIPSKYPKPKNKQ